MFHKAEGLINSINLSKKSTWHISFRGFLGFYEGKSEYNFASVSSSTARYLAISFKDYLKKQSWGVIIFVIIFGRLFRRFVFDLKYLFFKYLA